MTEQNNSTEHPTIGISVVTLFPALVMSVAGSGVTGRAVERQRLSLATYNPRDYTTDTHRTVDDRPYGGGPGMVMMAEPLEEAIDSALEENSAHKDALVVYLSPQGQRLDHNLVCELAQLPGLVLVAGRYEGVDERLLESRIDREISIGDYVLSGGELAAMVVIDAVARQLPGVLGHSDSAKQDTFAGTGLLEHPQYTRPEQYRGMQVPEVLTGGNHEDIRLWRKKKSLERTRQRRPELLAQLELSSEDRRLLQEIEVEKTDRSDN